MDKFIKKISLTTPILSTSIYGMDNSEKKIKRSNSLESKCSVSIKKIKSNLIINKIFYSMSENKCLKIVKYNKNLQEKLNINLEYYKKYFDIVIDIYLDKNNFTKRENIIKFINTENIYRGSINVFFKYNNDNNYGLFVNENIYITKKLRMNLEKIIVILKNDLNNFEKLFYGCFCIKRIDFLKFNRKDITSMKFMFTECTFLREINFNNFHTDNVENMSYMFSGCENLKNIDLKKFKTNNVTNMSGMFCDCKKITKLDLSHFDTKKVKYMEHLFSGCDNLKFLDLSNFNTKNVVTMSYLFEECRLLKILDLSNFNTENVNDMSYMFSECEKLEELNLKYFVINKTCNTEGMFDGCNKLNKIISIRLEGKFKLLLNNQKNVNENLKLDYSKKK